VKTKVLLVLITGLFLGADGKDDAKNDQKQLQGKWKLTSGVIDGNEIPKNQIKGHLVFDKDKYSYATGDGEKGSGTFKIDPSKNPKHLDSVPADGPVQGQTVQQIYEIDGDNLKICLALPGTDRPTAFKSEAASGLWLFTYKRVK